MKKIVVIQSGWVVIGNVTRVGDITHIDNAYVIRKWGTTSGLGEIAIKGPTPETILDYAGVVEVMNHAVIMSIACDV